MPIAATEPAPESARKDSLAEPGPEHRCSRCPRGRFCLPFGLSQPQAEGLDRIMRVSRPLQGKQHLYRAGDLFRTVYSVRTGAFKSTTIDCDGYEQVVGFHLPGELIGLDGLYAGMHECSVSALTVSTVCVFSYRQLFELATRMPALMERLLKLIGKEASDSKAAAGDYMAEERLAAFFLNLALRVQPRGELSLRVVLPMPRADIANHLRLAGETLSRALARFQEQGLVGLEHRVLTIENLEGLQYLARRVPQFQL